MSINIPLVFCLLPNKNTHKYSHLIIFIFLNVLKNYFITINSIILLYNPDVCYKTFMLFLHHVDVHFHVVCYCL